MSLSPESNRLPTLEAAVAYFADLDVATQYVVELRWPHGPVCPRCESQRHIYIGDRRIWKCLACLKQYSVKLGTFMEGSKVALNVWLAAIWMVANPNTRVSTWQFAERFGVTQKTAWLMFRRIEEAASC